MAEELDRDKIINDYMSNYNKVIDKYKKEKVEDLIEDINSAISKSDTQKINMIYDKISEWNNLVSNVQGARDSIISYDKSFKLPSIKEFLIIFDHIIKRWRFNTEAD